MNCNDVDRALRGESQLPPQAQDHVGSCNRCQELISALDTPIPVDPPSPATLRKIAAGIATNLPPVRPVAPARYFFGAFVGIFPCIVVLGVYRMGACAIAAMPPLQTVAMLCALPINTGLVAYC